MKILFALLSSLILFAGTASAVNEGLWPHTVYDTNCTDAKGSPAFTSGVYQLRPPPQTSGVQDNKCDHDARILESPQTADRTFGPLTIGPGKIGIVVYVDADVVSNDTDTWKIDILNLKPDDLADVVVASTATQSTEGDKVFAFYPALQTANGIALSPTATLDTFLPRTFYIRLDLISATSWDGSISWEEF